MSRRRGGGNRDPLPRHVQVSKAMSWLLRHGAEKEGLHLSPSGFLNVHDLLHSPRLRSLHVTFAELRQIVTDNDKQRFTLMPTTGLAAGEAEDTAGRTAPLPSADARDWQIRANQGHSLKLDSDRLLQPILPDRGNVPARAVHGTTHAAWKLIVASGGLKAMGRTHIHFAAGLPPGVSSLVEPDAVAAAATAPTPVVSGMRKSSAILMFLDVARAMQEGGIRFWLSDNGVILSEGQEDGLIPLRFFARVESRTPPAQILLRHGRLVNTQEEAAAQSARS